MSTEPRDRWKVLPGDPPEVVVADEDEICPYLPSQTARRPLRLPLSPLDGRQFGRRLDRGDRRYGRLLYAQECARCSACEPVRVDVRRFVPTSSQRRAKKRGDRELVVRMGTPLLDEARLALFYSHGEERDLRDPSERVGPEGYARFLIDTCTETLELSFFLDGRLVGIAITDVSEDALSAVYTYYDPQERGRSLGTYAILHQIDLCRAWSKPWLYLGLYVADNRHMNYKRAFLPQQRRIRGVWETFETARHEDGNPPREGV